MTRNGSVTSPSYITPGDSPKIAVLWMIFGSLSFGTMNALVKWTSLHADVWMIIMVRSAVIAFAVAVFAASRGISLRVIDKRTMLLRCVVGLTAMILYFTALGRIPIGQAVTLQYTAPLFVALLSGRVISERVEPTVVILVATAFAGIVLIVSPDLSSVDPDALLALGSGFFAAMAYMYVRELRNTDSVSSVVFWFAAFSVAGSMLQALPDIFDLDWRTLLRSSGYRSWSWRWAGGNYHGIPQSERRMGERILLPDSYSGHVLWIHTIQRDTGDFRLDRRCANRWVRSGTGIHGPFRRSRKLVLELEV